MGKICNSQFAAHTHTLTQHHQNNSQSIAIASFVYSNSNFKYTKQKTSARLLCAPFAVCLVGI